tara:strand:- start:356 stop:526 length:171 start_codon:yes stop_codon:yes gene_type:complete
MFIFWTFYLGKPSGFYLASKSINKKLSIDKIKKSNKQLVVRQERLRLFNKMNPKIF